MCKGKCARSLLGFQRAFSFPQVQNLTLSLSFQPIAMHPRNAAISKTTPLGNSHWQLPRSRQLSYSLGREQREVRIEHLSTDKPPVPQTVYVHFQIKLSEENLAVCNSLFLTLLINQKKKTQYFRLFAQKFFLNTKKKLCNRQFFLLVINYFVQKKMYSRVCYVCK